ncbi:putative histidinol-phosphatase [Halenospora varia]|nr:putative histidinol-phosphatase [Halenospora varia]
MAFSMHSHSGEFCPGHAKDNLEEIIQTAIARGMKTFALTEHMPRMEDADLYPEEIEANHTISLLLPRHHSFITHASNLRTKYSPQIHILIGFEAEWIRPSYHSLITTLASDPTIDFFIGSVHHVHEIPIDYDKSFYAKAVQKAGNEEKIFEDYFDAQFEMLETTKPRVVGHFDLIRLMADEPDAELKSKNGIWEKIVRNLKLVIEQGALLEINTSALRKGLKEPYPKREICEEFLRMGGKFTLSDDSHGIAQVGTNYMRAFEFLGRGENGDLKEKAVTLQDVRASFRE